MMDEFVAKFASVRTEPICSASCEAKCCMSGKKGAAGATAKMADSKSGKTMYYVGMRSFECKDTAEKMSKVAMSAMKGVNMAYRVDGKDFCCDKMAGDARQKTGKDMTYVVGKTCTPCKDTARVELDKAKVMAVMKALETTDKADKKA
jgi:hypothetical protein